MFQVIKFTNSSPRTSCLRSPEVFVDLLDFKTLRTEDQFVEFFVCLTHEHFYASTMIGERKTNVENGILLLFFSLETSFSEVNSLENYFLPTNFASQHANISFLYFILVQRRDDSKGKTGKQATHIYYFLNLYIIISYVQERVQRVVGLASAFEAFLFDLNLTNRQDMTTLGSYQCVKKWCLHKFFIIIFCNDARHGAPTKLSYKFVYIPHPRKEGVQEISTLF